MKLEPGMLCRVVNCENPNNLGKVVTVIGFVGKPPVPGPAGNGLWANDDWWEVDKLLIAKTVFGAAGATPYAREHNLQPINPDHQPADEDFRAELDKILSGTHARV